MFYPIAFYADHILAIDDIKIAPTDLGIHRGYSVFDFFKFIDGQNPYLEWYLDRLEHSVKTAGFILPYTRAQIVDICHQIFQANEISDGYIKMIVSAGPSNDGYTSQDSATLLAFALPIKEKDPSIYQLGTKLISKNYIRDFAEVKSTNYIVSAMMAPQLKKVGAADVLYRDGDYISECSRCNFYVVKNGEITTPKKNILKGITRKRILSLSQSIIKIKEGDVLYSDLLNVDEAFISSSSKGVMPVIGVDKLIIGKGEVGPITKMLMNKINSF